MHVYICVYCIYFYKYIFSRERRGCRRFSRALEWQLVRAVLHREVEGISCEARRWRVGLWAHDCVPRPDGGGIYRPRCTRRGDSRPESAQPSEATRRAGEVAVPALSPPQGGRRMFEMRRVSLATFLGWCGLPW